ncbi:MotA/TolQ/ExbB proton channel family protein [Uliginosibacterium sediminicola]|uniref:MotA/TolQ/ExbB proton channel family protein n=1 Tax=Uliginosibacterium sediminicola TaxID=2024550 RepID=A0ABU9YXX4_9RHOO
MNTGSASIIVEGTLWALAAFSVLTWAIILIKAVQNFRAKAENSTYRRAFQNTPTLSFVANHDNADSALSRIARTGFADLKSASEHLQRADQSWDRQDLVERGLRQQIQRERKALEGGLAFLATIGSTAPFVGLFGTVWGIMRALTGIASQGSASIEVVAGPIGEALIATGVGIAVAIPAVMAYNYFQRRLKTVIADFEDFAADFLKLAQLNHFLAAPSHLTAVHGAEKKVVA